VCTLVVSAQVGSYFALDCCATEQIIAILGDFSHLRLVAFAFLSQSAFWHLARFVLIK